MGLVTKEDSVKYSFMKAIVLAAGFSTRLYPMTKNFPKALLPVGNKTIVSYVIEEILAIKEIDEIYLVTNDCFYRHFLDWQEKNYPKKKIKIINNNVSCSDKRLGAIGDLNYVLEKLAFKDDVLVVASDTLTSLKVKDFVFFFKKNRGVVTGIFKAQKKSEIANRLGCAVVKGNKLVGFVEKPDNPPSLYMAVPYYIFPKESLSLINQYFKIGKNLDSPGSILTFLIGKIPTFVYRQDDGYYFDVGTSDVYDRVKTKF